MTKALTYTQPYAEKMLVQIQPYIEKAKPYVDTPYIAEKVETAKYAFAEAKTYATPCN